MQKVRSDAVGKRKHGPTDMVPSAPPGIEGLPSEAPIRTIVLILLIAVCAGARTCNGSYTQGLAVSS
jgi:hypothetical protein